MNFNDKSFGPKSLLTTQDKIGQSCILFFKPRFVRDFRRCRIRRNHLFHSLARSGYNHRWCEL